MTTKGKLICPKCQNFGMNKYLYYESTKNEDNQKIYAFYYTEYYGWKCWTVFNLCGAKNTWYDPLGCLGLCGENDINDEHRYMKCIGVIPGLFILFWLSLFYFPFFFIFDLYFYCCNRKKRKIYTNGDRLIYLDEEDNIWDKYSCNAYTEEYWNQYLNLFVCLKCSYRALTFRDFIENTISAEIYNETTFNLSNANFTNPGIQIGSPITVNFVIPQKGIISIISNSSTYFYAVLNSLYEMIPELREKNCIFMYNNKEMDLNSTMEQNKYISGENIILIEK